MLEVEDYCPCGKLYELCNSPRCEHFNWNEGGKEMDSATQAAMEIEAHERAQAVIETIEETLGIKIGPTEITEAALSLSDDEKIKLAATLWEAAMPPFTEPTAGVYVLSRQEHSIISRALRALETTPMPLTVGEEIKALRDRLLNGDHA